MLRLKLRLRRQHWMRLRRQLRVLGVLDLLVAANKTAAGQGGHIVGVGVCRWRWEMNWGYNTGSREAGIARV